MCLSSSIYQYSEVFLKYLPNECPIKSLLCQKLKHCFHLRKDFQIKGLQVSWELENYILENQYWNYKSDFKVRFEVAKFDYFEVADEVAYVAEFVMAHNPFIQQGKAIIPNNIRGQIVDRWLDGTGQRQIGRDLNIPKSTVQNICR